MNEASNYIEEFYDLSQVKEPNKVFCIRNSPRKQKVINVAPTIANDVDYFDPDNAAVIIDERSRDEILYRESTRKYINIRQVLQKNTIIIK